MIAVFICKDCSIKFEKQYPSYKNCPETIKCESCKKDIPRSFNYSFGVVGAMPTEVIDKTIGREAEERWIGIEDKRNDMRKIQEKTGATHLNMTKQGDLFPQKEHEVIERKEALNTYGELPVKDKDKLAEKSYSKFTGEYVTKK